MSLEEKILTVLAEMAKYDLWKNNLSIVKRLLEIIDNK